MKKNDWRRFLLAECLQAYTDFAPAEWKRLKALLITPKHKDTQLMGMTAFEYVKLETLQSTALGQLETRFGPLSAAAKERLATLSIAQLQYLLVNLVKGYSLKELGLED